MRLWVHTQCWRDYHSRRNSILFFRLHFKLTCPQSGLNPTLEFWEPPPPPDILGCCKIDVTAVASNNRLRKHELFPGPDALFRCVVSRGLTRCCEPISLKANILLPSYPIMYTKAWKSLFMGFFFFSFINPIPLEIELLSYPVSSGRFVVQARAWIKSLVCLHWSCGPWWSLWGSHGSVRNSASLWKEWLKWDWKCRCTNRGRRSLRWESSI